MLISFHQKLLNLKLYLLLPHFLYLTFILLQEPLEKIQVAGGFKIRVSPCQQADLLSFDHILQVGVNPLLQRNPVIIIFCGGNDHVG